MYAGGVMSTGTDWFRARIPSPDRIAAIDVGNFGHLVRQRAIVNGGVEPVRRVGIDDAAIASARDLAAAAAKASSEGASIEALPVEQRDALQLFVLVVSRPSLTLRDHYVTGESPLWEEIATKAQAISTVAKAVGRIEVAGRIHGTA